MFTIYIIVDGGPSFVRECETFEEAASLMVALEEENPDAHYQCLELKFASRVHPPKATEQPPEEYPENIGSPPGEYSESIDAPVE